MTGLGSSEMKTVVDSELAVAHLVFKVSVRSSHLDWKRVSNKCPLVFKRTPDEWV